MDSSNNKPVCIPTKKVLEILDTFKFFAEFYKLEVVFKPTEHKAVQYLSENYQKKPYVLSIASIGDDVEVLSKIFHNFNKYDKKCCVIVFRDAFLVKNGQITEEVISTDDPEGGSSTSTMNYRQYKHLTVVK